MEQEFFEAFEIEPKRRFFQCKKGIDYYEDCELVCNECSEAIYQEKYPPITPEIVLKLIKIIADKGYSFKVFEAEDMFNNGIKYVTNAITDIKHDIYGRGKAIDEAVISLCIQLKDEIQDQVRALFND